MVRCGDQGLDKIASCGDIRVCSTEKSTHYQKLSSYLPGKNLIPISSREQLREAFANGTCNVIAHEGYNLAESLVRSAGYEGEYLVGATLFSKEPLAMVTRQEDTELSDFVNSVLASLIVAEASNITQSTAEKFPQTEVWSEYPTMFRDAVAAVGNYGEVFARYMEIYTPRQGLNLINYGAGGLLYSIPLGNPEGSVGTPGTTLVAISERAKLRCGLRPNRPGFAVLEVDKLNGMEVDYCRALAASIFYGRTDQVEFITVSDQREGLALLASGELDVFAGATWNLQTDVRIPGIGEGFTLTQPFFYKPATSGVGEGGDENLCLATRQVDPVWSAFVYWISAAIIQAEEHGITQGMSNFMPDVTVFGPDFSLIFQDAILAVGNYGEMYSRNLENAIPRSGRNQLNGNKASQLYPLPGIFP